MDKRSSAFLLLTLIVLCFCILTVLPTGCDCGDPSTSSGQADDDQASPMPDDDDNDSSPVGDDDDNNDDNDNDNNDDVVEFCADGYLTPAGDCLTQIDGGDPGHNGVSAEVGPDGTLYVAAARGREFVIYSRAPDAAADDWQEEIVDRMAGDPVIAFGPNGRLHAAFLDLWTETIRYGKKTGGVWSFEDVEHIGGDYASDYRGPYLDLVVDNGGRPHLAYQKRVHNELSCVIRYARRDDNGWVFKTPLEQEETGSHANIIVDDNGVVHLLFGAGGALGISLIYYATNQTGHWQAELIQDWAHSPAMALSPDGTVHISYVYILSFSGEGYLHYCSGSFGSWRHERVFPTLFLNGIQAVSLRLDQDSRPHIFYGTIRELSNRERLEHAFLTVEGWQNEIVASDPADSIITYDFTDAYSTADGGVSVVSYSTEYGLVVHDADSKYQAITLGRGGAGDFGYHLNSADEEYFFYRLGYDRLIYRHFYSGGYDEHEITTECHITIGQMVIDPVGGEHLYYKWYPTSGTYYHWYEFNNGDAWETVSLPFDENAYIYPALAADAESMPHFFYTEEGILKRLWKDNGAWMEESLENDVSTQLAAVSDSESTLHVLFFNSTLGDLRYAVKGTGESWGISTVNHVDAEYIKSINLIIDNEYGDLAGCYIPYDYNSVVFVTLTDAGWTEEPLFTSFASEAFYGCGIGISGKKVAVVTSTESQEHLLAVRKSNLWTERVVDISNLGSGSEPLYWDTHGNLRFIYVSELAIQRATVPPDNQ